MGAFQVNARGLFPNALVKDASEPSKELTVAEGGLVLFN